MSGPIASVETGEILAAISPDEARRLTDRIRDSVEATWALLLEAHEQKAWAALGYATWAEYVSAEFNMSRRHSYRLLDHGRVVRAIEEATSSVTHGSHGSVSPTGDISERVARDVRPHLDDVTNEIQQRIAEEPDAEPDRVRYIVNDTISRHRNPEPEPHRAAEPEFTDEELHLKSTLETGRTIVVNYKTHPTLIDWAEAHGLLVRVDRRSDWGNPFAIPDDGDRHTVIDNYGRHYLPHKPSLLSRTSKLKGKALACWCHPEPCHGDVLATLAEEADK